MSPQEALTYWEQIRDNAVAQAARANHEIGVARHRMAEALGTLVMPIQFLVGEEGQGEE